VTVHDRDARGSTPVLTRQAIEQHRRGFFRSTYRRFRIGRFPTPEVRATGLPVIAINVQLINIAGPTTAATSMRPKATARP
jgi:hypothetical protein